MFTISAGDRRISSTINEKTSPLWVSLGIFRETTKRRNLEDYDFVFWIDADAIFYDQTRRIEEALHLEALLGCGDLDIWWSKSGRHFFQAPFKEMNETFRFCMVLFFFLEWY